jgi:hypothetical protein
LPAPGRSNDLAEQGQPRLIELRLGREPKEDGMDAGLGVMMIGIVLLALVLAIAR